MASRLIPLGIGALALFMLGITSLQLQVSRSEAFINFSAQPERVNNTFNMSKAVLSDLTLALGIGLPHIFGAAAIVLVVVLIYMAGGGGR